MKKIIFSFQILKKSIQNAYLLFSRKNKSDLEKKIYEGGIHIERVVGLKSLKFLDFSELVATNNNICW